MATNEFLSEIRMFGFNFPPKGWTFCNGQLMSISQNTALFSLLGTNYGGDGRVTFALPNLQGMAPMHFGQGGGLSNRSLGEIGGEQYVTLLQTEMPAHNHLANANSSGTLADPANNFWGNPGTQRPLPNFYATAGNNLTMNVQDLSIAGGSQPHNNLMPFLVLNFCIALQGVFPARN